MILALLRQAFSDLGNLIEYGVRWMVITLTNRLPVKVIRDDKGVPFLYRYHLFTLGNDGPGLCIHRFVKSDPERGYHDHPWKKAISFIMCGRYDERILDKDSSEGYITHGRERWTFNYLNGVDTFHRVMVEEGKDVWTLFAFQKRSKTWGMVSLDGQYKPMSTTVTDNDGGWWNIVGRGLGLHSHLPHAGKVIATVDAVIVDGGKVLLIKRGKEPFKGLLAFPGGRIEEKDANLLAAAHRELYEETHLSDVNLEYYKTIGNNKRDPRGFCLTSIFIGKLIGPVTGIRAGDDAVDYEWFDLSCFSRDRTSESVPDMAFDHKEILMDLIANHLI